MLDFRVWRYLLISVQQRAKPGPLSRRTTTLFNILANEAGNGYRDHSGVIGQLVKIIKLMSFNSDHLAFVDLCKVMIIVIRRISYGVDSLAYAQLLPLCSFPFGGELAAFARR